MNVTREVVTDLLPIYFSGEASGDTKVLVEDYFRQDPDFERIARSAAAPLETLRAAAPIAAGPEKEKCDLESGVLLEPGPALLVSLFRAPAPTGSLPGRCDISYADPRSLRLALCLRRRVSGRGRDNRLDLCGSGLDRVF